MYYVIAILLCAVVYLFYLYSVIVKEQNWQNDLLNELDKDLKKLEIMNDVNITIGGNDESN
jgi:hypothetical protein